MHTCARIIHAGSASILYLLLLPSSTSLLLSLLLACASRDIVLERFAASSSSSSSSYSSRGEIISLIFLVLFSFFVVYIPANNVQQYREGRMDRRRFPGNEKGRKCFSFRKDKN